MMHARPVSAGTSVTPSPALRRPPPPPAPSALNSKTIPYTSTQYLHPPPPHPPCPSSPHGLACDKASPSHSPTITLRARWFGYFGKIDKR